MKTKANFRLEDFMKRQSRWKDRIAFARAGLLVLIVAAGAALAQGTAAIHGTVKDPQGNVIAGASVTLISPSTNATRTTTTRDSGAYSFDAVDPGDYRIEVE